MAQTLYRQAINTFEDTVSGGSQPPASKIIKVFDWVKRLSPYETPLLSLIGYGPEIDQDIYYWGQSYQLGHSGVLAEDLTVGETAIDVAAGTGERFHKYQVIAVTDYDGSGYLDHSTREIMWVTNVLDDTLTVDRGEGGTADVVHTGTGLYPALVEVVGQALPQNTDFVITPVIRGDQQYNYFQRFFGMVQADQMARHMPTHENKTDILLEDLEETTKMVKLSLEKAIIYGGRQRGVIGTPTATLMGGLDTFITTNVTDLAGVNLSLYSLESEIRDLWKSVGENRATKLLMSADTASLFDTLLNPYREASMDTTSATLMLDKVKFRFATFDIVVSRWIPNGIIYGIRPEFIKVHPFKGNNWQVEDVPTSGPYQKKAIWGDFSLSLKAESTMFRIAGFSQNEANYDRNSFI